MKNRLSPSLSGLILCFSVELEEVTPTQDMGYEFVKKKKEGKWNRNKGERWNQFRLCAINHHFLFTGLDSSSL